jgi:hypothetical protein
MSILSSLGCEVITKMLAALTQTDGVKHLPSIDEQKWYIKKSIDSLSVNCRRTVCLLCIMNGNASLLKQINDDVLIVLDDLSPIVIEQIYIFITYKTIISR